jgi:hypothetical protein
MQWARQTKEIGYLRVGFNGGFQWRTAVEGSYESDLRLASSINGGQFLHRVSNYQLSTWTLIRGVIECGAQPNENNLS